jgi:hypothetical protein
MRWLPQEIWFINTGGAMDDEDTFIRELLQLNAVAGRGSTRRSPTRATAHPSSTTPSGASPPKPAASASTRRATDRRTRPPDRRAVQASVHPAAEHPALAAAAVTSAFSREAREKPCAGSTPRAQKDLRQSCHLAESFKRFFAGFHAICISSCAPAVELAHDSPQDGGALWTEEKCNRGGAEHAEAERGEDQATVLVARATRPCWVRR